MALFPFFRFLYIFFVKLTLAVTMGWTNIPSDGGDITPKFLSGIIISPSGKRLKSYPKLSFLKLNLTDKHVGRYWMLLANIRRGLNLFITDRGMNLSMTRVLFQGSLHNRRFMSQARQTWHFARLALHAKCRVRLVWVRSANPRWRPIRCWERALVHDSLSRDQA